MEVHPIYVHIYFPQYPQVEKRHMANPLLFSTNLQDFHKITKMKLSQTFKP